MISVLLNTIYDTKVHHFLEISLIVCKHVRSIGLPHFMWCECNSYQFFQGMDNGLLEIDVVCITSFFAMLSDKLKFICNIYV